MFEASYIVGSISAAVLILALAAWINLFRVPALQPTNGGSAPNVSGAETASRLLVSGFGLSAVAAILSVFGLFAN